MCWKHKENANGKKKEKKKLLVLKKEGWVKKRNTGFLKKLNTELAYDPEIPLQIYIQKKWKHMSTQKLDMNVYSSVIHNSERYKQRKGPWTDEWINKRWSIRYNGMLFSHEKKEALKWTAMWMNFNSTWSLKGIGGCLGDETVLKPEMVAAFHEHTKIPLSCYNFKTIIVCYVNFTTIKILFEKVQTQKTIKLGT